MLLSFTVNVISFVFLVFTGLCTYYRSGEPKLCTPERSIGLVRYSLYTIARRVTVVTKYCVTHTRRFELLFQKIYLDQTFLIPIIILLVIFIHQYVVVRTQNER